MKNPTSTKSTQCYGIKIDDTMFQTNQTNNFHKTYNIILLLLYTRISNIYDRLKIKSILYCTYVVYFIVRMTV